MLLLPNVLIVMLHVQHVQVELTINVLHVKVPYISLTRLVSVLAQQHITLITPMEFAQLVCLLVQHVQILHHVPHVQVEPS
jgi:hypothetical protein